LRHAPTRRRNSATVRETTGDRVDAATASALLVMAGT
jgi:hypothetical protein